jgi:hypothetical protein
MKASLTDVEASAVDEAFGRLVDRGGGYGGGVLRIEASCTGVLYEGSWGKVQSSRCAHRGPHSELGPAATNR